MKKIIALSDTHGNKVDLNKLIPLFEEADAVLFAGDGITDFFALPLSVQKKLICVKGNCDGAAESRERVLTFEGCTVLLTHGDSYGVKQSMTALSLRAREVGANLVVYGHTHLADEAFVDGVLYVNPGTVSPFATQKSFSYIVINGEKAVATINRNFFGGF